MLSEASKKKLTKRIQDLVKKYEISENISYSLQKKHEKYNCVIRYQKDGAWKQFWVSTELYAEKGNVRNAKKCAEEIYNIFKEEIRKREKENHKNDDDFIDLELIAKYNTTNYYPNKKTKADMDFYEFMEYWLYHVIKKSVALNTFNGYERNVTGWMKKYFTMRRHQKQVKAITADDLEEFYDYLRDNNLKNASVDHYNDNISSAFKYLLRKKIVRYNPTDMVEPIKVEVIEVPTYTKSDIIKLFDTIKGDPIELPILIDGYYGLRRSEIIGLRKCVFDFENNSFIINHVALQNDGKDNKEKVYFQDRTKSKKGCRNLPLFPDVKRAIEDRLKQIEENKKLFGDTYNYEYDEYICVQDNGDLIQPNYFTKRFKKIIDHNNLKKITPHGLRHSIATLLHLEGTDIRDLQDWLGHQNISSTNRYTRSDYQKQLSTGNTIEKMLGRNNKEKTKVKRFIIKKKNIHMAV